MIFETGKAIRFGALLAILLTTSNCAANRQRPDNADTFATAGITYVDSIPAVLDEAFELSVAAGSLALIQTREDFTETERLERISKQDDLLMDRLSILRQLRQHSLLLRTYFISLKALATDDSATEISESTKGVLGKLGKLRPSIEQTTLGNAKISDLVEPAANLIVGHYKNKALEGHLEKHGEIIERELALQKAALSALTEDMIDNAETKIQLEQKVPLALEYVEARKLKSDWNARRVAAFKQTIDLGSLDAIGKSSSNMHASWIALVENHASQDTMVLLLEDVGQLLTVAELFKSND